MYRIYIPLTVVFSALGTAPSTAESGEWRELLKQRLPEYGHRNWIVIADSAYPKQSSPGVETIYTGGDQVEVVKHVLETIDKTQHVRPVVMLDKELESIPSEAVPGIKAYRSSLRELLRDRPKNVLPHEKIIERLDESAELFNVLVLQSDMVMPYTSVFIQLDCGYWSAEEEKLLRKSMAQGSADSDKLQMPSAH